MTSTAINIFWVCVHKPSSRNRASMHDTLLCEFKDVVGTELQPSKANVPRNCVLHKVHEAFTCSMPIVWWPSNASRTLPTSPNQSSAAGNEIPGLFFFFFSCSLCAPCSASFPLLCTSLNTFESFSMGHTGQISRVSALPNPRLKPSRLVMQFGQRGSELVCNHPTCWSYVSKASPLGAERQACKPPSPPYCGASMGFPPPSPVEQWLQRRAQQRSYPCRCWTPPWPAEVRLGLHNSVQPGPFHPPRPEQVDDAALSTSGTATIMSIAHFVRATPLSVSEPTSALQSPSIFDFPSSSVSSRSQSEVTSSGACASAMTLQ